MALFYSDGGPAQAHRLVRVNVEGTGSDFAAWRAASADRWDSVAGWIPYPNAQLDITQLGELYMVDASEVPKIQEGIRAWLAAAK